MAEVIADGKSGKVVITNIGLLLSGDIDRPILDADTIVVEDGLIVAVGKAKDCDCSHARTTIDVHQTCVAPGLIDSHVHPVFGDWTPRQNQLGWIESTMNGGVTTMISAGEVHLPGRPKDIVGLKALAITAQRAFDNFRPGGVKVLAGAPIIEKGMVENDFKELAEAGVTLLGEVGLGSVKAGYEAKEMVAWARKYGIQSTIHTGGPSIPGSGLIDKDVVLEADADIIGLLSRDDYQAGEESDNPGLSCLDLVKNRNGATGPIPLTFVADLMRFESGAPSRELELAQPGRDFQD